MSLYDRYRRFATDHPWRSMALLGLIIGALLLPVVAALGESVVGALRVAALYGLGTFALGGFVRWSSLYRTESASARRTLAQPQKRWVAERGVRAYGVFAAAVLVVALVLVARRAASPAQ